jgi:hypothetical protein
MAASNAAFSRLLLIFRSGLHPPADPVEAWGDTASNS